MSLDFGRCPISKFTTHSPRMVNNPYYAPTPDLTRCYRAYGVQVCHIMLHISFPIHGKQFFSFITNLMSICQRACINIILFTHRMKFNHQAITHNRSLIWDLNSTRHHPTSTFQTHKKNKNLFIYLFYFIFSKHCVSIATKNSCPLHTGHGQAPRLPGRTRDRAVSRARVGVLRA